jgi:hypothetical protein
MNGPHVLVRAHNPLSGIGSSNPASAKWASAQQCAGTSEDHSSKLVESKPAVRVRQYRTKPRKNDEEERMELRLPLYDRAAPCEVLLPGRLEFQ